MALLDTCQVLGFFSKGFIDVYRHCCRLWWIAGRFRPWVYLPWEAKLQSIEPIG